MEKCFKDHLLSDPGIFNDFGLLSHADIIASRLAAAKNRQEQFLSQRTISSFTDYHLYFGLHRNKDSWVIREWAPFATKIYLVSEKTFWQEDEDFLLEKKENNVFEKYFPKDMFCHGDLFRFKVIWKGGEGDRIPTAATRVVQDSHTLIFNAQVWHPENEYQWQIKNFIPSPKSLLIYEAHVGMALEDDRIGSYLEFEKYILPQIIDAGYNTIQFMAIQEHPYYGSFGYHVSNFFAASSRFGTPEELKSLIDTAHKNNIRVLMDIIHSHAVNNEVEGIAKFDGTNYQFFHDGPRGHHRLWDSRCFDYSKPQVIRFLLSNLKYWIEEYKIDGFRFDGITSMLFKDHGLGRAFTCYGDYYQDDVDVDALSYLYLANSFIHKINPDIITIAEDMSGYPGLAAQASKGGTGFDYRFAMGVPDFWIKLLKDHKDEQWPLARLWHELTNKRKEEKTISYAESHDQALVGDKTIMMHLMGDKIYTSMEKTNESSETYRAVALHKMIRLITIATAGSGYLNFMGNEFGHPEWIDFPSTRNNWSFHYARRQWSLKYDQNLYFSSLFEFDRTMISIARESDFLSGTNINLLWLHEDDKVIAFERFNMVFVFNFHHLKSFSDYMFDVQPGKYSMVLNSDEPEFGGQERLRKNQTHFTIFDAKNYGERNLISLYLPSRCAMILKKED
jgi:1,4-alpha-glucan branching enzyme